MSYPYAKTESELSIQPSCLTLLNCYPELDRNHIIRIAL